jgi:rubrerythrin
MESLEVARARVVLDRLATEKEIAHDFFNRIGEGLEDVEQRRWFRRMAQDEKDQRKILVKHRKELCRNVMDGTDPVLPISAGHVALAALTKETELDFAGLLRVAVRAAEEARLFCDRASDLIGDRSCRIFLKILVEESRSHRDELRVELRAAERRINIEAGAESEAA